VWLWLVIYDVHCPFCRHDLLDGVDVDLTAFSRYRSTRLRAPFSVVQVHQHPWKIITYYHEPSLLCSNMFPSPTGWMECSMAGFLWAWVLAILRWGPPVQNTHSSEGLELSQCMQPIYMENLGYLWPFVLWTRDLPDVALVITFFTTLFTKKKLNFWTNAPFCKFYNVIVKTSQQLFKINGRNAFGCPLRLGLYLKVECMNLSETSFSRTSESRRLWQGANCHVWTSQLDKHWWHSQKQLQKYNIKDFRFLQTPTLASS